MSVPISIKIPLLIFLTICLSKNISYFRNIIKIRKLIVWVFFLNNSIRQY